MALIQCPECNGAISELASKCPHCGSSLTAQREKDLIGRLAYLFWLGIPALLILLIILFPFVVECVGDVAEVEKETSGDRGGIHGVWRINTHGHKVL